MEQYELAEDNLQEVTGGLDRDSKIVIGVGAGTVATLGAGAIALATRKPRAAQQVASAVQHATPVQHATSARNSKVENWLNDPTNIFDAAPPTKPDWKRFYSI